MATDTGDEVVSSDDGAVTELHSNKEEEEKMKDVEEEEQQQQLLPYLDEGIVTNILVKVHSAESLVKSLRYVCKLWSNIIFHHPDIHLNSLLPSKPPCLIVQHMDYSSPSYIRYITQEELYAIHYNPKYNTYFVKMGKEGVVEQHLDLTPLFTKLLIRACANGLMLVSPSNKLTTLCVVNPLTNHWVVLPPVPVPADVFPALASVKFIFFPRTQNYKVLLPVEKFDNILEEETSYVYVLTLSSSGDFCQLSSSNDDDPSRLWRVFEVPLPTIGIPLAIDGVMYWSTDCHGEGYYILSFDVTSEIFYTSTPHNLFDGVYAFSQGIMDMGGYIAVWFVLHDEPKAGDYTIDVHVTKDLHMPAGGAKWKEVYRRVAIDPGFVKAYRNAAPSVGNGEAILFRNMKGGPLVVYNFKSQQWWQVVGNNLTVPDDCVCFYGYHVENMPVPFDSLFSLKQ